MRNKGFRRHQKQRMKNKAKRVARDVWGYRQGDGVVENMVRNCDNLKVCNGDCCKNPRRSGWEPAKGKTRQELRHEL